MGSPGHGAASRPPGSGTAAGGRNERSSIVHKASGFSFLPNAIILKTTLEDAGGGLRLNTMLACLLDVFKAHLR